MRDESKEEKPQPEDDDGGPPVRALIGLAIIALLVLAGIWLTRQLHSSATMQDCMAAGRTNCAPIEAPSRP